MPAGSSDPRSLAMEIWLTTAGMVYRAASAEAEDEAVSRIIGMLREASSIASVWASHAPPSPAVKSIATSFGEWVRLVLEDLGKALETGSMAEARRQAELVLEAFRTTHSILSFEASRYRFGFQLPVVLMAVVMILASILGAIHGLPGLLASIISSSILMAGAAATSFSPRLSMVSLILGGAVILASLPPVETAMIVGAGLVASGLAYIGLASRHVSLTLPEPGIKRGEVEEEAGEAMSEEELVSRLEELYRRIYGDQWRSVMEYDISVLMKAGFSRREAMIRRLRELGEKS